MNVEVRATIAERGKRDLYFLAREVLGDGMFDSPRLVERVHKPVCDFFVRKDPTVPITRQSRRKNRALFDPRGHLKTTLDIADMVQWALCFPNIRMLLMSGTKPFAARMTDEWAYHFEKNAVMREVYPEYCSGLIYGKEGEATLPNRTQFWREPTISVASADTVKASGHYDIRKGDDVVNEDNSKNQTQLQETTKDWKSTRPLVPRGYSDFIDTRYDFSDCGGDIIESNPPIDGKVTDLDGFGLMWHGKDWDIFIRACWKLDEQGKKTLLFPEEHCTDEDYDPEKENLDAIQREDPYIFSCFPAGSKVLMSDWTERPIESLKTGDEIVGYNFGNRYGHLEKATVQYCHTEESIVIEAVTESGRVIRCTPDHKFLVSKHRERKGGYKPLHVGFTLCSVYTPAPPTSPEEQRLLDWLGGIIDGEGSAGSSVAISQSPSINPEVFAAIHQALKDLKIEYTFRSDSDQFIMQGGKSLKARLLQHAKMAKRERFLKSLWKRGGRVSESNDKVVSMRILGKQTVYNIQSSSGNYVCEGFATKNCQYMNNPSPTGTQSFQRELLVAQTVPRTQIPSNCMLFMVWYPGFNPDDTTDPAAGIVGGFSPDGSLYIIDCFRGLWSTDKIIDSTFTAHRKWCLRKIGFDDKNGPILIGPGIDSKMREQRVYLPIDYLPVPHSAEMRMKSVEALVPLLTSRKLFFSSDLPNYDQMLLEFTRFGKYRFAGIPFAIATLAQHYRSAYQRMLSSAMQQEPAGEVYGARSHSMFHDIQQSSEDCQELSAGIVG